MKPSEIRFKYTENTGETYHRIECDGGSAEVLVIGDGESAAYEWVIVRGGEVDQHSDDAYGQPAAALRDGLVEYFR